MNFANWALRASPTCSTGVNISSIWVFDQIRDPDIPIRQSPFASERSYTAMKVFTMGGSPGALSEELVT